MIKETLSRMCNIFRAELRVNFVSFLSNLALVMPTLTQSYIIKSAKIVLVHLFFQYCDNNIRLFSIASCKVIALNLLCYIFGIFFCYFLDCSLELSLRAITFPCSLQTQERPTSITVEKIGRAISQYWENKQFDSAKKIILNFGFTNIVFVN